MSQTKKDKYLTFSSHFRIQKRRKKGREEGKRGKGRRRERKGGERRKEGGRQVARHCGSNL
jgi:hypothetical protein